MHQVNLEDQVYETAQRQAAAAGFDSVDDYFTDMVVNGVDDETSNFDHLFTPERMAIIQAADAEIDAGLGLTIEEAEREFAKRREEWLRQHPQSE
jgi:hypothetical protein